jgi:uncharacterized protein YgbK (DUF1537 family)
MLLGCIADDFTGASDLANTLTRAGMRTLLALGVPHPNDSHDADAIVVALKTRSCPPAEAVAQSLAAYAWLRKAGAQQVVFKICSTFDSRFAGEPRGNIGPVGEALRLAVVAAQGERCIAVCPAFPATGRTVYQGHLFVGDRPLHETGMARHPITPMTDPDLARVLQAQCEGRVDRIALSTVRAGAGAIAGRLNELAAAGASFAIVDATSDDDLRTLGTALDGVPLAIGASGIALGLPVNFERRGLLLPQLPVAPRLPGRCVLLAGSCSVATRAQVADYARANPLLQVDPARVDDAGYVSDVAAWCERHDAPLVASSAAPDAVAAARTRHGDGLDERIEHFFGRLARRLHDDGVRRFVIAGGETSGAVVGALALRVLQVGHEIDPGVPALFSVAGEEPVALALKSGNFGGIDFLTRALHFV